MKKSLYFLSNHSHKNRKDSLVGNLDRLLFVPELEFPKILVPRLSHVTELEFPKILVPRLSQNTSNENIECAKKSKQLYSLSLKALIYLHFVVLVLMFLTGYTLCTLCNLWLLLFENNSRSVNIQELNTAEKSLLYLLLKTGW